MGWYSNAHRKIVSSSLNKGTSSARWYRRPGHKEDPWISLTDHGQAISEGNILYGEASFGHAHAAAVLPKHKGADVYVRMISSGKSKSDFMRISPTYTHPFISNGDGTFTTKTYHYPHGWNFGTNLNVYAIVTGDWNGDGKTDFMRVAPTLSYTFISTGDGTFTTKTYHYPHGWNFGTNLHVYAIVTGDWNGDGKTDFMRIHGTLS